MYVDVGGNHIGGEGAVNVGDEVIGKRSSGADIYGGTGNGEGGEEDAEDKVFSGIIEEGLWSDGDMLKMANGDSALRPRTRSIGAVEDVRGGAERMMGLEKGFIQEEGVDLVLG